MVDRAPPTLEDGPLMNHNLKLILAALCALFLVGAAYGQNHHLPDGKGKAELIRGCTDCHSANLVVQKRRTPEDWKKVVDDMAARTSENSPKDVDNILRYLDTNFGLKKTAGAAPQCSAPAHP